MRRQVPARLIAVAIAAGSMMLIPFAAPVNAATVGASCKKLVSPPPITVKGVSTSKSTVSGCTPLAATGGTGKSVTNLKTLTSVTTWAKGAGTTTVKISYKVGPKANKCPKGTSSIVSGGKVTASTGAAAKVIKKGQVVSARVCVNSKTSAASLEPGQLYKF
jgi:hypothetical protein